MSTNWLLGLTLGIGLALVMSTPALAYGPRECDIAGTCEPADPPPPPSRDVAQYPAPQPDRVIPAVPPVATRNAGPYPAAEPTATSTPEPTPSLEPSPEVSPAALTGTDDSQVLGSWADSRAAVPMVLALIGMLAIVFSEFRYGKDPQWNPGRRTTDLRQQFAHLRTPPKA